MAERIPYCEGVRSAESTYQKEIFSFEAIL
ncbi:hypothetical protein ACVW2L_003423 [Mucilaginibacter sp. HD30]